jgi:hypothetical protein
MKYILRKAGVQLQIDWIAFRISSGKPYNGHSIGTRMMAIRKITTVSSEPTLRKSTKRYLPGPYTIKQDGSNGVR